MRNFSFCLLLVLVQGAPAANVDLYRAKELQAEGQSLAGKGKPFASKDLARYGNHYTMLAHRESSGSAELHEHEADIFIVETGDATLISGGTVLHGHTEKPGEIRGTGIEGGERQELATGDIVHIPAGTPHQLLIHKGHPFTYFVVKVTGQ